MVGSEIALSVVVPCYNEEDNVTALTERLLGVFEKRAIAGEILLVNDGSSDGTGVMIDKLAAQYEGRVVALHHATNKGIEGGWRSGTIHARGLYVCFIDADLQYLPEDVWRLYREITVSQCDVVQGVRSTIGRVRDYRYYLSKGLNSLLNVANGMALKDNKSGFVLGLRETMIDILSHRYHYSYFQSLIAVAAAAKGYSWREVEVLFQPRVTGQSFIAGMPVRMIARTFVDLVKGVVEYRLFRKHHETLTNFLRLNPPPRGNEPYTGWRKLLLELFFHTMPLHKWLLTRDVRRMVAELQNSQWLPQEKIRELQELRLRSLIRHAYSRVPYYRRLLDDLGLKPSDIRTINDLQKLPLLGKNDVRANLHFDLFATNHNKGDMLRIGTSGSTGEPFVTYVDRKQLEMRWATTFRAMEWTGWRFGDRQARLWHQTIGMSLSQIIRERIDAWFMRRIFIPAFEMKDSNLPSFIDRIRRHKPVLVDGYAECFNFLAYYAKTHGVEGVYPKAMISSAQVLPDQVRAVVEEQFKTKVFDKYGSREFSGIAYECDHFQGHHVMAESYIVEIIKDGRPALPGEIGEIVITDLNNHCVPLIRYRVGDLAVAVDNSVPCSCGRGLPRIGKIEGRVHSIIVCANGAWLPGSFFLHYLKDYEFAIRQFQVVQNQRGAIDFKVVKGAQFNEKVLGEIVQGFHKFVGDDMTINVIFVDSIPLVRTGKRTSVVSNLGLEFQNLADGPEAEAKAEEVDALSS